jgi:hypothetical protein
MPSSDADVADLTDAMMADAAGVTLSDVGGHAAACEDRLSLLRIPAIVLGVLGIVGLALWPGSEPRPAPS